MIHKNERRDTLLTVFSKAAIVLINLAIVACITQFWGAEGKGYQAIFIVNLGFIMVVTNIFTNSSISFFVRKVGASKLFAQACLWIFISSTIGLFLCYYFDSNVPSLFLFIACLLTGYLTFHNALYIGMQKIKYFNFITILQPLFLLIAMFLLFKTTKIDYFGYFYAHIISLIMVIAIAHLLTQKTVGSIKWQFDFSVAKNSFHYGFQNELSNFFHLLAIRLSYYFILYYLGEVSLGVFSVGISISESIWHISRSISLVQYSKIVKEGNTKNVRKGVVVASLFSLVFSLFCMIIILLLPKLMFSYVFGNEFAEVKPIVLMMSPGILCVAFSTVYGHYFAAIGKMKILVWKSIVGAILTLLLSMVLIPLWEMNGACITSSIVHFVCSAIIIAYFIIGNGKEKIKIGK
jgi:O-antigen/teichoic acid export membrane protein